MNKLINIKTKKQKKNPRTLCCIGNEKLLPPNLRFFHNTMEKTYSKREKGLLPKWCVFVL